MSSDHETADWDTHIPRGGWITDRYAISNEGNEDDERNQEIEADDAVPVRE